jgi:tol-pal system protein YbgF
MQRGLTPAEELLPEIDIMKLHDDAAKALSAVEKLQGEVEGLRARLTACEAACADSRMAVAADTVPSEAISSRPESPRRERRAPVPSESELYRRALDAFRARDYHAALRTLSTMVEHYPDGGYAENGRYWIGECYYGLERYSQAVVSFRRVLELPAKTKNDDAQLKLGICYVKLGQTDEARRSFESLLREYPSSEYVHRARSYLAKLSR